MKVFLWPFSRPIYHWKQGKEGETGLELWKLWRLACLSAAELEITGSKERKRKMFLISTDWQDGSKLTWIYISTLGCITKEERKRGENFLGSLQALIPRVFFNKRSPWWTLFPSLFSRKPNYKSWYRKANILMKFGDGSPAGQLAMNTPSLVVITFLLAFMWCCSVSSFKI